MFEGVVCRSLFFEPGKAATSRQTSDNLGANEAGSLGNAVPRFLHDWSDGLEASENRYMTVSLKTGIPVCLFVLLS